MKKIYLLTLATFFKTLVFAQSGLSFTITNSTGTNSITCYSASVTLLASSNYTLAPVNYSWSGPGVSATGTIVTVTNPGNFTVVASAGTLTSTQVKSIGINTTIPTVSLSSVSFTLSNQNPSQTLTVTSLSPTLNLTQVLYTPTGGTIISNGYKDICPLSTPGTYTHCTIDNVNGCQSCVLINVIVSTDLQKAGGTEKFLKLYPSPASDQLSLTFTEQANLLFNTDTRIHAKIIAAHGQLVAEKDLVFSGDTGTLNTKDLPDGIYFLQLSNGGSEFLTRRFIIYRAPATQ